MSIGVGIVFTTKNCLEFTKNAIKSVKTTQPHNVVIMDDGSTDGTVGWASSEGFTVLHGGEIPSLGGKWNLAAKMVFDMGADFVLVCNNDIIFSPLTIDALVSRFTLGIDRGESLGMVTAHNMRGKMSTNKLLKLTELPWVATENDGPDFSCFLLSKHAFETVGPFSTDYIPCYFEDNDYHIRMAQSGFRAISTTGAPYYHFGSVTQNSVVGGLCKGEQFEKNRKTFSDKFGFETGSPEYQKIIDSMKPVV